MVLFQWSGGMTDVTLSKLLYIQYLCGWQAFSTNALLTNWLVWIESKSTSMHLFSLVMIYVNFWVLTYKWPLQSAWRIWRIDSVPCLWMCHWLMHLVTTSCVVTCSTTNQTTTVSSMCTFDYNEWFAWRLVLPAPFAQGSLLNSSFFGVFLMFHFRCQAIVRSSTVSLSVMVRSGINVTLGRCHGLCESSFLHMELWYFRFTSTNAILNSLRSKSFIGTSQPQTMTSNETL